MEGKLMIKVELHSVPEGTQAYEAVAHLTIHSDGAHETWDPDGLIPWGIHALRPGAETGRGLERVHFEEEPVEWARRLHTILRTGYIVPADGLHRAGGRAGHRA